MSPTSRIVALALLALTLTACADAAPPPSPGQTESVINGDTISPTKVATVNGDDIWRFCDGKNLVYVADAYNGNSIAVIANAPECAR